MKISDIKNYFKTRFFFSNFEENLTQDFLIQGVDMIFASFIRDAAGVLGPMLLNFFVRNL
jgi:hypothetical protein